MSKESKILDNMLEQILTISSIDCSKCGKKENEYDDIHLAERLIKEGWHATPTKAYCHKCNPYKVIRDKK